MNKFRFTDNQIIAVLKQAEAGMGSPPFSRTLTRRPIQAMSSVHVKASQVQCRVQAWCGGASQSARCQLRPGARELGIGDSLLTRWKREAQTAGKAAFAGTGSPRDEEVARLKRELARITRERDFLREAATFFAKGSS